GGPGLHAHRGAVELPRALHVELSVDHEALSVVVVHADEIEAEARVAREGPGGVAREYIDLARLDRGEALLRGERRVAHLARVAEHRRSHRAAEVDVDAAPYARRVGKRESREAGIDAALHEALAAHVVERR